MWYFRILQFALVVLLVIYYGTILLEVFSNGKLDFIDHDISDNKIWIPFYAWINKSGRKNNKKNV